MLLWWRVGRRATARSTLARRGSAQRGMAWINIDTAREKFPNTMVSEIRALLRRKCNNEGYTKVAPQ
ncbi:unnamed protein product [Boreogadus saida]